MQCLFEVCTPRTHGAPDLERDKKKQINKKRTPHFRTYSRRALYDLPKLCMLIELVEALKNDIHFLIQRIVFPTGCMKNLA